MSQALLWQSKRVHLLPQLLNEVVVLFVCRLRCDDARVGAALSRDAAFNRIALCPLIGVRAKSKDGFSDFPQVFWWQFRLYKCSPDVL